MRIQPSSRPATAGGDDVIEFTSVACLPARAVKTRWLRNDLGALPFGERVAAVCALIERLPTPGMALGAA